MTVLKVEAETLPQSHYTQPGIPGLAFDTCTQVWQSNMAFPTAKIRFWAGARHQQPVCFRTSSLRGSLG